MFFVVRSKQVIRLLIIALIMFAICWGPIITVETLNATVTGFSIDETALESFYVLSYANSAINPILYGILSG